MSRAPHMIREARFGQKMGSVQMVDMLSGGLSDPFGHGLMGVTAENVAQKWQITRAEQDAFALESQRRATAAIKAGHFDSQILPVEVRKGRDTIAFRVDEYVKQDATPEALAGLKPAFRKDGSVTPGNSSGINDAAAALVLMEEHRAGRTGKKPMARIVGYAHAGVEPAEMGIGPVPAVRNLLKRTGMKVSDFDVIESNEAFAAQACAVSRELDFDPNKVNPNGGAIALGHPVGASGAIITIKCAYELHRTGGRYGLVTMCIGGGQGIAMAIERM
jgi:acetyl-CoA C-acetyltransferase